MTHDELQVILAGHKEWLKDNTKGKRANLRDADLRGTDLSDANLRGANLKGANLSYADLSDANLRGVNLRGVNLSDADLSDANLRDANLRGVNLRGADLRDANLRDANLSDANLRYADLRYANLKGANLRGANLRDADLLCMGNQKELKTLQLDKWDVGYTYDTLQIGCQRHAIEKWLKWDTEAGRRWISLMDVGALEWANKFLPLVLNLIKVSPAAK